MPPALRAHRRSQELNEIALPSAVRTLTALPLETLYTMLSEAEEHSSAAEDITSALYIVEMRKCVPVAIRNGVFDTAAACDVVAEQFARAFIYRHTVNASHPGACGYMALAVTRAAKNISRNATRRAALEQQVAGDTMLTSSSGDQLPHGQPTRADAWIDDEHTRGVATRLRCCIQSMRQADQYMLARALDDSGEHREALSVRDRKAGFDARRRLARLLSADPASQDRAR